jgi:hypothetical protein
MRRAALILIVACRGAHPQPPPSQLIFDDDLLRGLRAEPWLDSPGTSEQFFPIFVGASARELVLGGPRGGRPRLAAALRDRGTAQARRIAEALGAPHVELEAWPSQDGDGQPAWVFARWRRAGDPSWTWLTEASWRAPAGEPKPLLPLQRDPARAKDELFGDILAATDLYFQPRFGSCVFVARATGAVALAWPDPREREARAPELVRPGAYDAYCVNQPARLDDRPVAFAVAVDRGAVRWPAELDWLPAPAPQPPAVERPLQIERWPAELAARYDDDLRIAAGERAPRPAIARFAKRGAFQPDHDLERMVDYLDERYRALGLATVRQRFTWRGIAQSNLIAIIAGREPGPPVVLADHIDAAVEEDTFERTGRRVTTHGADDNATATAMLLAAAATLRDTRPRHDLWLVHFTGEEFPADCLGARHFLSELLRARRDVRAVVITDFIGWHHPGRPAFQLSPTSVPGSERIAALALDAARRLAPGLVALYAPRDRSRNAVYQTDLLEFELHGIPGVLFNEDMDYADPATASPHNHRSTDVVANVDQPFALAVAKVAIETALRLAND